MSCLALYTKIENFIGTKFESYAGFVCRYPWVFIICPLVVESFLGIGLINLQSDNNVENIYTPRNSQSKKDRDHLISIYGDSSGTNFFPQNEIELSLYGDIIFKSKTESNILRLQYITEIESIVSSITSLEYKNVDGQSTNYTNTCAIRNSKCYVQGAILFSSWFQTHLQANSIPYPSPSNTSFEGIFGDTNVSNGVLNSASYIKVRIYLRHDYTIAKNNALKWMEAFKGKLSETKGNLTHIYYAHSKSLDEELNANISGDILFFSLTFTLMIVYATTATANYRCVSDRQNLSRAGVLAAVFAILGSFGTVSACGLDFVSIVGTMPFLILGIGVDDMFLLLSGLSETYDNQMTYQERIKRTMRTSGVGITITSLTDLLAFFVGASSTFNSVRNFCVYTGVAVMFCYLNYVTFFLGCMVVHEQRVSSRRHCCTCHIISPSTRNKKDNLLQDQPYSCFCTGQPPDKRSEVEGPLEKYPPKLISKFILLNPVKVIVLVFFAVYLGVSVWGVTNFQQGLVLNNLVAEDSYFFQYSQKDTNYFRSSLPISVNIPFTMTYSNNQTWTKVFKLQSDLQAVQDIDKTKSLNWYQSYRDSAVFDSSSEFNFITALRTKFFISMQHFENDVKFDSSNTSIVASRFYVFGTEVSDSNKQGALLKNLRSLVSSSSIPNAIVFAPAFIFYEQYIAILPNTLQTLGIAVAAIFVVTAIFLPHPVLVLFVTITLAMIIVGLFGFMYFWGLTLSSITMIHIIMSVGFSVDFSAHICHGFMDSAHHDRNEGAKGAIIRAGGPIFNGAMSSFIGIIMLLFSKSFIFKSFFKVMFLIIVFGAAHSLLFLPVVLSIIGPKFSKKTEPGTTKKGPETEDEDKTMTYLNKVFNESEKGESDRDPRPLPLPPIRTTKSKS